MATLCTCTTRAAADALCFVYKQTRSHARARARVAGVSRNQLLDHLRLRRRTRDVHARHGVHVSVRA